MAGSIQQQFRRFFSVGVVGFTIDGLLLWLLVVLGVDAIIARVVSLTGAATLTWWLNRGWTFYAQKRDSKLGEYLRYALVQIIGSGLNLGVYSALILLWPALLSALLAPLSVGGIVGMGFNFLCARYWVFLPNNVPYTQP